jgi:fructose-1,6-bisphosphatase II
MWSLQLSQVEKLKEYGFDDLIRGEDVVFVAAGITPGETLHRVRYFRGGARTHTVVMSTEPRMVRFMEPFTSLSPMRVRGASNSRKH